MVLQIEVFEPTTGCYKNSNHKITTITFSIERVIDQIITIKIITESIGRIHTIINMLFNY